MLWLSETGKPKSARHIYVSNLSVFFFRQDKEAPWPIYSAACRSSTTEGLSNCCTRPTPLKVSVTRGKSDPCLLWSRTGRNYSNPVMPLALCTRLTWGNMPFITDCLWKFCGPCNKRTHWIEVGSEDGTKFLLCQNCITNQVKEIQEERSDY